MEGGRSAWLKHVMSVKKAHPSWSLGDAMKAAKKTYKKKGGMLGMPPMGGRRRKTVKVGGTAYGFTGGPYTGSELADGAGRFPTLPDATWKPSGGRRRRSRRGGADVASTHGKPAELPGDKSADAPDTGMSPAGTLPSGAAPPSAFGVGGRRRRHTKKAGKRRH